jgi:enamine deaminase RidA (YjgF/YER057c/UK114 family)
MLFERECSSIEDWRDVGRAHAETFAGIKPAISCVGGVTLMAPELLVEIEATAVLPAGR